MGNFYGAICELIGINLLHELSKKIDKNYITLYRDKGFIILIKSKPELKS